MIANVLRGRHFVLVVGWDANDDDILCVIVSTWLRRRSLDGYLGCRCTLQYQLTGRLVETPTYRYINDSGFYTISYSLSNDVVGWRLFNMTDVKQLI